MKIGLVTIAYREERLIGKFLSHIPAWVDEKVVLLSSEPWFGEPLPEDKTREIAEDAGAMVIEYPWESETDQRNAGQDFLLDCDWILVLDPDEYLDNASWDRLHDILLETPHDALIVGGQFTYWKDGYVADPPADYPMLIAVRPHVRFIDKRVVGSPYAQTDIWLHHFSWAKTDREVWDKISHYAHAEDFDIKAWYDTVWLPWTPGMEDVHPNTPATLHRLIPATLPPELERLQLWP